MYRCKQIGKTQTMKELILVVEDEPLLAMFLASCLKSSGFHSHCIFDGAEVIDWVKQSQPDLILMDVILPHYDGITLCREIRKFSTVPLFMLTSCINDFDRLRGLNSGADDYICKPYNPNEVLARINAMFRRLKHFSQDFPVVSGFRLNKDSFQACYNGQELDLTLSEFRILAILLNKPNKVYSRIALFEALHDEDSERLPRSVDGHIKNLRKKIKDISNSDQEIIETIYGVGYKINC